MYQSNLRKQFSIGVVGAQIVLLFALSTLPTPLYATYTDKFHLSGLALTAIFAGYTIGTLSTLLFLGRSSDQIGRRGVSLTAIVFGIGALLLFVFVKDPIMLLLARIITGLATGLSSGTAIAWMRDLYAQNEKTASRNAVTLNILGLGFGPLLSGLLAAFAPSPMSLSYLVFAVLFIFLAFGVWFAEETVDKRQRQKEISLRPRIGVPHNLRAAFAAPALAIFVTFSLVGFYSVITPNVLTKMLHLGNLAIVGGVIFELFLVGALVAYVAFRLSSHTSMLTGTATMLPALGLLVVSQLAHSFIILLIGTAFGGASMGFAYRGALEIVNMIAPPNRRAEMVSSLFIVGNVSLAIPVLGIGFLAGISSQETANITFAVVVGSFAIVGLLLSVKMRKHYILG